MPLIFDDQGRFLWEFYLFLRDHVAIKPGASDRTNTLFAYADDLSVWWSFLEENDIAWNEIHDPTIHDYVAVLSRAVSPKTGRKYAVATIHRRVHTVLLFYEWAAGEGLARVYGNVLKRVPNMRVSRDELHLAAVMRKRPERRSVVNLKQNDPADHVNILTQTELRTILAHIGPDLISGKFHQAISIRNRLIAELALYTGMRLHEVLGLTKAQILSLTPGSEELHPTALVKLRLFVTKGGRRRDVLLPAFLHRACKYYIETERLSVLKASRPRSAGDREPPQLFLNSEDTNRVYVGRPLRGKVVSRQFSAAVRACGYFNESETQNGIKKTARFRFHDLRHTFAVYQYRALEAVGKREPWKYVQSLLGHRHLSTTINIYLKHVRIDEVVVGDAFSQHIRMVADAE